MSQVERLLNTIELLMQYPGGMSLRKISEKLDVPKSAAFRLLAQLRERGYVQQYTEGGDYQLSLLLPAMGIKLMAETDFTKLMQPAINELSNTTGELVRLSIVIETDLVWVASAYKRKTGLKVDSLSGVKVPPHVTAAGKIWLASMTDEAAAQVALARGLEGDGGRYGPNAITTVKKLISELEGVRAKGIATVRDEAELGVAAVAIGLHDADKGLFGALSIASPTVRVSTQDLKRYGKLLSEKAPEMEQAWGLWKQAVANTGVVSPLTTEMLFSAR